MRKIHVKKIEHEFINSQADDCADLQIGGVFRDFDHEGVILVSFEPPISPLKFHEEFDFDSFELDKITEKYFTHQSTVLENN